MANKKRVNLTMDDATRERLEQYAHENHLASLSAALEYIAWNVIKVKNTQVRGQISIDRQ